MRLASSSRSPETALSVLQLLELPFPADAGSDPRTGELVVDPEGWSRLYGLFEKFGLRLPVGALTEDVYSTWCELVDFYGPSVRLQARLLAGGPRRTALEALTDVQQRYVEAVAAGSFEQARQLARTVFSRANTRQFWSFS